jgi:transposase
MDIRSYHRPDLKQFMMNLISVGDGDIPMMMEVVSGNQADKARFAGLLQEFKQQCTFELFLSDRLFM